MEFGGHKEKNPETWMIH